MLKILFSANKAVTKSSDMEHNYRWLTEEVRSSVQSLSSEAVSADPLILPSSACQGHASQSASHDAAPVWKPHTDIGTEQCLCWVRPEVHLWTISSSCLHLLEMKEPNLHSLQNTGQPQIHTEVQQRSRLSPFLLSQYCLTFDSLLSSEHLANIFTELIILSCFLFLVFWPVIYPHKGLCLHTVAAWKAPWKPKLLLTPLCIQASLALFIQVPLSLQDKCFLKLSSEQSYTSHFCSISRRFQ